MQVFPLAQFYNTLQGTLSIIMSNAVSFLAEALISVRRLEAFMLLGMSGLGLGMIEHSMRCAQTTSGDVNKQRVPLITELDFIFCALCNYFFNFLIYLEACTLSDWFFSFNTYLPT